MVYYNSGNVQSIYGSPAIVSGTTGFGDSDVYSINTYYSQYRPYLDLFLYGLTGDLDLSLYADTNRNGLFDPGVDVLVGSSAKGGTNKEVIRFDTSSASGTTSQGKYLAVVTPYASSSSNYDLSIGQVSTVFSSSASFKFDLGPTFSAPSSTSTNNQYIFEYHPPSALKMNGQVFLSSPTAKLTIRFYEDDNLNGIFDRQDSASYFFQTFSNNQAIDFNIPNVNGFLSFSTDQTNVDFTLTGSFGNKGDFTKDGKTDILLQSQTSKLAGIWGMNGTSVASWTQLPSTNGLDIVGKGDLTNDGYDDILLQSQTSKLAGIWGMNGTSVASWTQLPSTNGLDIVGTGDFTNDGKTDILLQSQASKLAGIWGMNGTSVASWTQLPSTNGLDIVGTGDFNGDGKTDILLQNQISKLSGIWGMNGTNVASWTQLPTTSGLNIAGTGDFNGDGKTDILLQNQNSTLAGIWGMNNTSVASWTQLPTTNGLSIVM